MLNHNAPVYILKIEDSSNLSGESVSKFLNDISNLLRIDFFSFTDVVGSGVEEISTQKLYSLRSSIMEMAKVTQFDWAFVFGFKCRPEPNILQLNEKELLSISEICMRLVDSNYIYLYTTNFEIMNKVSRLFLCAEIERVSWADIVFPY